MDRNSVFPFYRSPFLRSGFLREAALQNVCFYISDGFNLFKSVDIFNPTFVFDVFEACFYNKRFCTRFFFSLGWLRGAQIEHLNVKF